MQLGVGLGLPYTLGKPAAAFSPLDLSPVLWLDASDTSTITESGGAVSQWDDKSGGTAATQGTAANQPTTGVTTLNGLNVIDFDGSDWMNRTTTPSTDTVTVVMVVSWSGARNAFFGGATSATPGVYQTTTGSTSFATDLGGMTATLGATDTGSILLITMGNSLVWRKNAVDVKTGGTLGDATGDSITQWGRLARASVFLTGSIAEIIVVDGTLTAGEIAATESYLADKWGITL